MIYSLVPTRGARKNLKSGVFQIVSFSLKDLRRRYLNVADKEVAVKQQNWL
ncbi:MAG: hypothetical protein V2B18_25715 [Pseudomonadota bacterium]